MRLDHVAGACDRRGGPHLNLVRNLDDLFTALQRSTFRRRFRLGAHERGYLAAKGWPTVLAHAHDFIAQRLAPAAPPNDGRQTPMRGHPVFVAQHATGTCCRTCLAKWHHIAAGREMSAAEQAHAVEAIERWLRAQMDSPPPTKKHRDDPPSLFDGD